MSAGTRTWAVEDELSLLDVVGQVHAVEAELDGARAAAEAVFRPRVEAGPAVNECTAKAQRIRWLKETVAARRRAIAKRKSELAEAQSFLEMRKNAYLRARRKLGEEMSWLDSNVEIISRNRDLLYQVLHELIQERAAIAAAIARTFPIASLDRKSYTIRSVPVPNSDYEVRHDPIAVSAALGWICLILQAATEVFDLPNRYHITVLGSKSTIQDPVSDQVYPLFEQNTSPFLFEYGVFLLNNCIAEMLESRGIPVTNLQMTLANLKLLIDSVAQANVDLIAHHSPFARPNSSYGPAPPPITLLFPAAQLSSTSLHLGTSPEFPDAHHPHHHHAAAPLSSSSDAPTPRAASSSGDSGIRRASSGTAMLLVAGATGGGSTSSLASSPSVGYGGGARSPSMAASPSSDVVSVAAAMASHRRVAQSGEWRVVNGQLKTIDTSGRWA
ncbi:hypothetical protein H9P43_003321 [Blastocladiella emersonii ATCC 22665]|nr:hypothetical protein H9P43_003321 [Blastocladiella emersonii ATCC 22665]